MYDEWSNNFHSFILDFSYDKIIMKKDVICEEKNRCKKNPEK